MYTEFSYIQSREAKDYVKEKEKSFLSSIALQMIRILRLNFLLVLFFSPWFNYKRFAACKKCLPWKLNQCTYMQWCCVLGTGSGSFLIFLVPIPSLLKGMVWFVLPVPRFLKTNPFRHKFCALTPRLFSFSKECRCILDGFVGNIRL